MSKNLHQQGPYKLSWPWHWSLLSHYVTVCVVGMWMGCHIADTVRVNIARWPLCKTCLKYEVKEDAGKQDIQGVMDSAMTQQYRWVIIFHHANIRAHGGEEEISSLSHTIVVFLGGGGGGGLLHNVQNRTCPCKPKAYIGLSRNVEFYQLCTHRSLLHRPCASLTFLPVYWFGGKVK
jgi:hypothetical protein